MDGLLNYAQSLDWEPGITKHAQTFRLFLRAASIGARRKYARKIAREFVRSSGGVLCERDIHRQSARAYAIVEGQNPALVNPARFLLGSLGSLAPRTPLATSFNRELLRQYASGFPDEVTRTYLRDKSTTWPTSWRSFLWGLYGQQVVLVFNNMKARRPLHLSALPPENLSGPNGIWFLCNPVDGKMHMTAEGSASWRSKEAVTDFRHLVLESDFTGDGVEEDWLRFLVQLPMPIRAIYTSGGKSVHALVAVNASSKENWDMLVHPLKRKLAECGADVGAISAVRLTRLPFCFRESTGRWQELLYYNPDAAGRPIAEVRR